MEITDYVSYDLALKLKECALAAGLFAALELIKNGE